MSSQAKTVHIIFTTHWDREWVQSFELFRYRLVELVDRVLDILAREPEFIFTFDGQTIVLEDYLAVRPEAQARLQRFAREGRLVVGPWYVLADQFLEGPEATVRNLLIGQGITQEYGGAMHEGYVPDSFGSIATLPALLNGFGIRYANMGRGMTRHDLATGCVFRWGWHDGSEVLTMNQGYGNASGLVYATPESREAAGKCFIDAHSSRYPGTLIYGSIGGDHFVPPTDVMDVLRALDQGEHRWIVSTPEQFLRAIDDELHDSGQQPECLIGEMRGSKQAPMQLTGVLSSDIALKQKNRRAEVVLAGMLDPLSVFYRAVSGHSQQFALRRAWKLLISGHAHDSICACSTDAVMEDIHNRLRRVDELITLSGERMLRSVTPTCGDGGTPPGVLIFNGQPERGRDAFNALARVAYRLTAPAYDLIDADGVRIGEAQVVCYRRIDGETSAATNADCSKLFCKAPEASHPDNEVYTHLAIRGVMDFGEGSGSHVARLVPATQPATTLEASADHLANALVEFRVTSDGRLSLIDKSTGQRYANLGWFEDLADCGDTYDYGTLAADKPLRSFMQAAVTSRLLHSDALSATLEVTTRWKLPVGLDGCGRREQRVAFNRWPQPTAGQRSDDMIEHTIVANYTLYAGMARVDAQLRFLNQSQQHRLRLGFHFDAPLAIHAGAHFTSIARPWSQPDDLFPTHPLLDYLHVEHGLAILVKGLYEYEPRQGDEGNELLVTICRSTDTIGPAAGNNYDVEHAKVLLEHTIDYALYPSTGIADTIHQATAFTTPVITEGLLDADVPLPRTRMLYCDNSQLVISACKRSEDDDAVIIRLWNCSAETQSANLAWGLPYGECSRVELSETPSLRPAAEEIATGEFRVTVQPYEIVTLKLSDLSSY